jgi:hypothetical protein
MTRDTNGHPDFEPVDDNGLTAAQSAAWRAMYIAIGELIKEAVSTSPTPLEAHRRLGLLHLELRVHASAVEVLTPHWNDQTALAPKDTTHG